MPQLVNLDDVRDRLEHDRPWAAFSLADLDAPYSQHAAWFGPSSGRSVVLLYGAYEPPIAIAHGELADCDAVCADARFVERTPRVYLNVTPDHLPLVARHFRSFEQRRMVRMLLDGDVVSGSASAAEIVRLGPGDLEELRELYAEEPPAFFLPGQLRDGVYFGVREGRDLIAVAGTHVVSTASGVAAVGNVYTRRDRRRRGLAAAVTRAVTVELHRLTIPTVVLNIVASNLVARRVYERLGFREYCLYYEGLAER